jgi:hypothetical protein
LPFVDDASYLGRFTLRQFKRFERAVKDMKGFCGHGSLTEVLLLGAMPFVDCGEIEQKFTKSGPAQMQPYAIICNQLSSEA